MTEKKRAGTHSGDVERAYVGRKTPAQGTRIPVEIDPETTPPPQVPPELEAMGIEEQVRIIRDGLVEHTEAIERVWASRNLSENVQHIGKDVAELSALMREFLMPAVKTLLGRVDAIERANEAEKGRESRFWEHEWPTALKTLELISGHMGRIEKDVDRVERNLDNHIKRGEATDLALQSQVNELKSEIAKSEARVLKVEEESEKRIRTLEDFALSVRSKVALLSAGAGGGGAGLMWLVHHFLLGG